MNDQPAPDRPSALAPFKHSIFRSVWIASLASNFGGLIQSVGAAWMMTAISNSADMVALVQASTALPIMLFSLASGAIADNYNRRKVMIAAQGFMFAVSIALTLAAYFDFLTPWLLLSFTFLLGCGTALNNPSWQAAVGDMVPRSDLPAAVSVNSMGFNLTRSVGPAIGGIIVAAAGAAAAFAVNAVSYLPLLFVLSRWKQKETPSTLPRETLGIAMTAGLRYVAMSPNIEKVLLRGFVFGFTAISVLALLPLVARDIVQGGPLLYGVLLGAFGIGAVGGALINAWLRQKLSSEWIVRLGFMGFAVCASVAALSQMAWLTCAALLIGGGSWVISLSLFNVTVQMSTPRWVVGRALSLYQTATFGGMALGSWIWGVIAENHGAGQALLASAALMIAGAALGLKWFTLPEQTSLNLDPLNRWKEPHLALDVKPRSGPIVIMIEYVIALKDTAEFLDAMAERRRVRRRDGARQWTLARDLENPELWMETYHTPTWVEYVRHNQRITHADAIVGERVRKLHSGQEPPRVHRMIERPTDWSVTIAPPKDMLDLH
ncbi:MFS transporter [Mesorhizobium sp. CGMCC 1.15528]|uniref:MFS transporter n=1 Tax=Mesorhizobium zhangyense TaxID=1776730 RepID=A0A7C9VF66_9HYPH|nr:MFS transporter [Mesorhizobium zhangyense]NGN43191.1 MFS transporter [Mesorhizobium zhangyense]